MSRLILIRAGRSEYDVMVDGVRCGRIRRIVSDGMELWEVLSADDSHPTGARYASRTRAAAVSARQVPA